jgi:hypothetical protein
LFLQRTDIGLHCGGVPTLVGERELLLIQVVNRKETLAVLLK